jgi:glucose/arabinose dehydrogenase
VVERRGVIWVYGDGQMMSEPFLDIREQVTDRGQEQGLLGLAFDPAFADSGAFWINYTAGRGNTTLSRFTVSAADANRADPASEQVLLTLDQPAGNHNGGMLAFGPDGMLWMGTGDGGAANDRFGHGQNPSTLLGKMLRLDVTSTPGSYAIPGDNPWIDTAWNGQDVRDEVWAVGLRNPWRYSFDRQTGDLWIGDVGQNVYEEIHLVAAGDAGGLNFGWPIMEGTHCFPDSADCDPTGLEIPVIDYRHGSDGCSVTGGYVYRGQAIPQLDGVYLYSDYCSGKIWGLYPDGETLANALLMTAQANVSSFGEDESGELYVVDLGQGTVYRLGVE